MPENKIKIFQKCNGRDYRSYDFRQVDRLEREESCIRGRLVAVERLTRTTTTTKRLADDGEGSGGPEMAIRRDTFI